MDLYKVTKVTFIVLRQLAFPVKVIRQRRSAPPSVELDRPDLMTSVESEYGKPLQVARLVHLHAMKWKIHKMSL
jgi:hypothetical protein